MVERKENYYEILVVKGLLNAKPGSKSVKGKPQ